MLTTSKLNPSGVESWAIFLCITVTLVVLVQPCWGVCVSSCGKITNITHPFRLNTDPASCGKKMFEMKCVTNSNNNKNTTLLLLPLFSGEFSVQSINYHNYTIRLVDPNFHDPHNCSSLPRHFLYPFNFSESENNQNTIFSFFRKQVTIGSSYISALSSNVVYFYCPSDPISFVDATPCLDPRIYVTSPRDDIRLSDLKIGCHVIATTLCTWRSTSHDRQYKRNSSYVDIYERLVYGFELSWVDSACNEYCGSSSTSCHFNDTTQKLDCQTRYCDTVGGTTYQCGAWSKFVRYTPAILISILNAMFYVITLHSPTDSSSPPFNPYLYYPMLNAWYVLVSLVALRVFVGVTFLASLLIVKWRRRHLSMYENIEHFLQGNDLMPIRYSYREIKNMSRGFKEKLGEGGFGIVYKGKLCSGPYVAIKMLGKSKANGQEFISEVATIGRIHHVNVVRLIGFCVEGSKRALVYEFMSNGSLDKFIFSKEGSVPLNYEKVHEICLGVAHGITYLHHGCDMQILHFDIKPHNILLDDNFIPKVADFGLARLYPVDDSIVTLTAARGTIGYMAPELFYKNIGGVSYKSDVYSFGMLLMEMTSRRRNLNPHAEHSSQLYFPLWIYDQFNEEKDIEMEDLTQEDKDLAKKMFIIALWCIQLKPVNRPSMKRVVEMLEGRVEDIEMPPKPLLYPRETIMEDHGSNSDQKSSSDFIHSLNYAGDDVVVDGQN